MHKTYATLTEGSYKDLGSGANRVVYGRFSDREQFAVAVNSSEEPLLIRIPVWEMGISRTEKTKMKQLLKTDESGFTEAEVWYSVLSGFVKIKLPAHGAIVLYRNNTL